MKKLFICLFSFVLFACSSPLQKAQVTKDEWSNGATVISQGIVPANSSMGEPSHGLGFKWRSDNPSSVYILVGVTGVENVDGVEFIVDGQRLDTPKRVSALTEYASNSFTPNDMTSSYSYRIFSMSLSDFIKIANAHLVKYRINQINTYSVSTFGTDQPALVNQHFSEFMSQLQANGALKNNHK